MAEPTRLGEGLEELLASMKRTARERLLSGEFAKCPHLQNGENFCEMGKHYIAVDLGPDEGPDHQHTRLCPDEVQRLAEKRRGEVLDGSGHVLTIAGRYGLRDWDLRKPLWQQLLSAIDKTRRVRVQVGDRWLSLDAVLAMVRRGCEDPRADAPNMMLVGPCGTGKTTLQAVLYLGAAEAGLDAAFLDSIDIRNLVNDLNSRYGPTAEQADKDLSRLLRSEVIFWSDVGDTQATRREFAETISALLERFEGRLVTSTNLSPPDLEKHPDIGLRAASRMLSARNGKPAVLLTFEGADQRRAGIRAQQEITAL